MKSSTLKWALAVAIAAALPITAAMADESRPATANETVSPKPMQTSSTAARDVEKAKRADADNTALNKRDRNDASTLPTDQPNNSADIETAAAVRSAIVGDDSLSTLAHNIKLVAANGKVVLRGPVKSVTEKNRVAELARQVPGVTSVDNLLEIDAD